MDEVTLRPIGVVRSPLSDPAQAPHQGPEAGSRAVIEIESSWAQGLTGLAPGRDLWVICLFHLSPGPKLLTHPRGDQDRPLTGVFNTRSPRRPCPLALTLVRLLAIEEGPGGPRLTVLGLEAVEGTPVLDIKPYVPGLDQPRRGMTMHKTLDSFDGVTHFWCPILGQPINFGYCRKTNEGLPCPRVLTCYESHFDVAGFIEQNYSEAERRAFLAPAPGKLERICRGLDAAKPDQDPEP